MVRRNCHQEEGHRDTAWALKMEEGVISQETQATLEAANARAEASPGTRRSLPLAVSPRHPDSTHGCVVDSVAQQPQETDVMSDLFGRHARHSFLECHHIGWWSGPLLLCTLTVVISPLPPDGGCCDPLRLPAQRCYQSNFLWGTAQVIRSGDMVGVQEGQNQALWLQASPLKLCIGSKGAPKSWWPAAWSLVQQHSQAGLWEVMGSGGL